MLAGLGYQPPPEEACSFIWPLMGQKCFPMPNPGIALCHSPSASSSQEGAEPGTSLCFPSPRCCREQWGHLSASSPGWTPPVPSASSQDMPPALLPSLVPPPSASKSLNILFCVVQSRTPSSIQDETAPLNTGGESPLLTCWPRCLMHPKIHSALGCTLLTRAEPASNRSALENTAFNQHKVTWITLSWCWKEGNSIWRWSVVNECVSHQVYHKHTSVRKTVSSEQLSAVPMPSFLLLWPVSVQSVLSDCWIRITSVRKTSCTTTNHLGVIPR